MGLIQPFSSLAFTDGTNPNAGAVGEYTDTSIVQAAAVSLTSGATINLFRLDLLPGDWDLFAAVNFGVGLLTLSNKVTCGTSQTSQTFNLDPRSGYLVDANRMSMVIPRARQKIAAQTDPTLTTPVYFVLNVTFTLSTLTAWGFMSARRPV